MKITGLDKKLHLQCAIGVNRLPKTGQAVYIIQYLLVDYDSGVTLTVNIPQTKLTFGSLLSRLIEFGKSKKKEMFIEFGYGKIPIDKRNDGDVKMLNETIAMMQDTLLKCDIDNHKQIDELFGKTIGELSN